MTPELAELLLAADRELRDAIDARTYPAAACGLVWAVYARLEREGHHAGTVETLEAYRLVASVLAGVKEAMRVWPGDAETACGVLLSGERRRLARLVAKAEAVRRHMEQVA